jgi:hypothetical protein
MLNCYTRSKNKIIIPVMMFIDLLSDLSRRIVILSDSKDIKSQWIQRQTRACARDPAEQVAAETKQSLSQGTLTNKNKLKKEKMNSSEIKRDGGRTERNHAGSHVRKGVSR